MRECCQDIEICTWKLLSELTFSSQNWKALFWLADHVLPCIHLLPPLALSHDPVSKNGTSNLSHSFYEILHLVEKWHTKNKPELIFLQNIRQINKKSANIATSKTRHVARWRPFLHELVNKRAYRFFLFFHPRRHLWNRSVDSCKVWKIWYVFCFENWHRPRGVQRPGSESYLAHLEMTYSVCKLFGH